jgi:ribosomal protein L5
VLRLLRKPITFRNVPMIERITVHTFVKQVLQHGSGPLHVAGMVLQAITNVRVQTHKSRTGVSAWGLLPGKSIAATATLKGEDMYHFLGKVVNVVLPRIKDWRGIRATSGDGSGNLSFGLDVEVVGAFPEIEINYDSSVETSSADALEMDANGFQLPPEDDTWLPRHHSYYCQHRQRREAAPANDRHTVSWEGCQLMYTVSAYCVMIRQTDVPISHERDFEVLGQSNLPR